MTDYINKLIKFVSDNAYEIGLLWFFITIMIVCDKLQKLL